MYQNDETFHHAMAMMTDLLLKCEVVKKRIMHLLLLAQHTLTSSCLLAENIFHYSTFMEMRIGIQLP